VWIVVGQGVLVRPLSRKFSPRAILAISALVLAIALPMLLLPSHAYVLFFILPFIAMSNGLTMPNYNAIISNLAGKKSQGEILGINQSIQALAMALPPLIAGLIVTIDRNFPIMMSGIVTLSAWLVFMLFFRVEDSHTYDQA
jgi:DHA1 family tetracycline resistance protein-like MFS transporter